MKKQVLKKYLSLIIAAAFSFTAAGCTNSAGQDRLNPAVTEENNQKVIENNEQTSYPLTVKDSFGKEVTVESEPEKVISLAPNITELIYILGMQDKLIGRTDYCDYPPAVSSVPSVGTLTTPDIEKIISLNPDIVIASTHFSEENSKKLEEAGIKEITLYEEKDLDGVDKIIETLGDVFNKKKRARETVENVNEKINAVKEKVQNLEQPSVYYVVGYGEGGDFSAPEDSFVGNLIKTAGGKDIVPASESWSYSKESLIEQDPDIIIVGKGEKENFIQTEGYKDLKAVKEDKVYEIDRNLLDRQSSRNADGVEVLAQIFHPDAFK